jgi:hypothetical protein
MNPPVFFLPGSRFTVVQASFAGPGAVSPNPTGSVSDRLRP